MYLRAFRLTLLLAALAVGVAAPTFASGLQVSPIGLHLAAAEQAQAMWLTNTGSETLHAQVRVFRWTQVDGKDVLEASKDLVVSPPMVTVAPGDRQLVRVIRQVAPPSDGKESAYRVVVDELPVGGADKTGLKFVLRYSIPVFIAPAGDPTVNATLQATVDTSPDGARLRVQNTGTGHAQIADVSRHDGAGKNTSLLPGLVGYALPGSTMSWPLPPEARQAGALRARINGEASESTLVVDAGSR
ncbi:fimbrial biogenesis chaperone [Luteibacter aegosomatissinici]|uniref:fimbrial biogenesis chaperone n=1 Tax=Luteibacter aegosomatissinici TaxID=2911539 RepID=UPI001FF9327E|nr:molecular chaperone [Luteibacter aegosomatissinici]UPG94132.1 molecular chaperone [Luteibacter aegosomatissinici]